VPERAEGVVEDRHVVVLAVAVAVGAWFGSAVPGSLSGRSGLVAVAAAGLIALRRRWIVVAILAGCLLAAILGARSLSGLDGPPGRARWAGTATLVSDPLRIGAGRKVELRLADGRRVEAFAYGAAGRCVADALAGERIAGSGTLARPPTVARDRLTWRHIATRLSLSACRPTTGEQVWFRAANGLRRLLMRGTESFPPEQRALWAGLVLGDDREEDPGITDDFSAAGLTHLLAVSGQNVAFALAAAGPFLRRLGLRGRLGAGLAVLGLFGVVVRFEPSVLRASAMAALALIANGKGVEASSIRLVSLAVTGLVLVDPLLVHRLGFQLSVAATVGIALWSRPLAQRLPGPQVVRESLSTTLAAQAAVAPLLVGLGGTSPVAVPANLLALPAAGPVMVWGLTGGLAAGIVGGPLATLVHLPSRILLAWLAGVAHVAARVPLPPVGIRAIALTMALAGAAAVAPRPWRRRLAVAAAIAFVGGSVITGLARPPALRADAPAAGVTIWRRDGTTVVALSAGDPARALSGLRRRAVGRIDLLAVDGSGPGVLAVLAAVLDRHDVAVLTGPPTLDVAGIQTLDRSGIRAGPFVVTADARHHPVVHATEVAPRRSQ
jgi:competence protein ComEC